MHIEFYLWLPTLSGTFDFLTAYVCIGSLVLFPWSLYRSCFNNRGLRRVKTVKYGVPLIFIAMILWPWLIRMMLRRLCGRKTNAKQILRLCFVSVICSYRSKTQLRIKQ